jgi:DNA-binding PucR family transcriptional regulator
LLECRDRGGAIRPGRADAAPTAVSGPAFGVAALPEATRQARFVLALLEAGSLAGPVAQFDRPDDLHAYRLLYEIWGSPAAKRFAHDLVGDLRLRDRRGELRQTLLALLTTGGSHVEAARRLGIHRNTLAYRLRQIDRALGRDARQGDALLGLHLALLVDALPPVGEESSKRPIELATG